ncbi:unnamed protein product [Closterium sp. NIES-54]
MGSPLRQGSRSRAWTDRQGDWTAGIDWDTHRWAVDNLIQLGGACRFTSADWNAVVPGHPRWKETQAPCSSSSSSPSSSSRSCSNSSSLAVSFAKILRGSARASFPVSAPPIQAPHKHKARFTPASRHSLVHCLGDFGLKPHHSST